MLIKKGMDLDHLLTNRHCDVNVKLFIGSLYETYARVIRDMLKSLHSDILNRFRCVKKEMI